MRMPQTVLSWAMSYLGQRIKFACIRTWLQMLLYSVFITQSFHGFHCLFQLGQCEQGDKDMCVCGNIMGTDPKQDGLRFVSFETDRKRVPSQKTTRHVLAHSFIADLHAFGIHSPCIQSISLGFAFMHMAVKQT